MAGIISRIGLLLCVFLSLHWNLAETTLNAEPIGSDTPLTLTEAIKIGLDNNPKMAAAQSQIDASEARVSQARSGFYPHVDFSEDFLRTTQPASVFGTKLNQGAITIDDFNPTRLNDPDPINNFATTFSVTMPIYDRGQIRIGLSQAKLGKDATSFTADRIRQQVIVDVVVSYVRVLMAQEHLGVVNQTLETARANFKIVSSRYRSGFVVKSDILRAEVRIAELEQMRLLAQSQVEIARAALNSAMGVEIERSFHLVTPLRRRSEMPGDLETWIEKSIKNRPELHRLKLHEAIAEEEVKKARAAHYPGLFLSGSYQINSENFSESVDNYTVGAILKFNLFSGFGLQAKVHEASAKSREVKAMNRHMELAIRVETRQAFFMARSAYQRIGVAQAAVAQAEEGLRIVRNRYESGLFTIVNLLDAEVALQEARTNYFRALHDFEVAMAQLRLAAGVIDENFL